MKISVYMKLLKETVSSINSICLISFSQVYHYWSFPHLQCELNVISQNMKGKNVNLLKLIIKAIALLTQYICKKTHKIETQEVKPFNKYRTSVSPTISRHLSITKLADNIAPEIILRYCSLSFSLPLQNFISPFNCISEIIILNNTNIHSSIIPISTTACEREN